MDKASLPVTCVYGRMQIIGYYGMDVRICICTTCIYKYVCIFIYIYIYVQLCVYIIYISPLKFPLQKARPWGPYKTHIASNLFF